MQQILLLQILKIPVWLIRKISSVFTLLTYLPNYCVLWLIDSILFSPFLNSTLLMYVLLWPINLILLNIATGIFIGEIYLLYLFLQLSEQVWWIQLIVLIFTLSGLGFLMRKGYLKLIQKYKPTKLKSLKEHLVLYSQFLVDIISLFCTIINILLFFKIKKMLTYHYQFNTQYAYFKFIISCLHQSIIYLLQLFFVKIFFRVFPWRFKANLQAIKLQQNNILNLLVLLSMLWMGTMLDILVLMLLGPLIMLHPIKTSFKLQMQKQHRYYLLAIKYTKFIILQSMLINLLLICIVLQPTSSFKQLIKITNATIITSDDFADSFYVLLLVLIRIPRLFCGAILYIAPYKYRKRQIMLKSKSYKQHEQQLLTILCFCQLIHDMLYYPLIFICTLLKPCNYFWLNMLLDNDQNLNRQLVLTYFKKCITDVLWIINIVILIFFLMPYSWTQTIRILRAYWLLRSYQSKLNRIIQPSLYNKLLLKLLGKIKNDFFSLPAFLIFRLCGWGIFEPEATINTFLNTHNTLLMIFYHSLTSYSANYMFYFKLIQQQQAAGRIQNQQQKLLFWKYAYSCQRYKRTNKILKWFILPYRITQVEKKIIKKTQFSVLSNQYWYHRQLRKEFYWQLIRRLKKMAFIVFGVVCLLPLTLWRLPHFIRLYTIHRNLKHFFPIIIRLYKQLPRDIYNLILLIIGLILAPRHYIILIFSVYFRYDGKLDLTTFNNKQLNLTKYLQNTLKIITLNYACCWKIMIIYTIWLRKYQYCKQLKKKQISIKFCFQSLYNRSNIPSLSKFIANPSQMQTLQFSKIYQISKITNKYFKNTISNIPYLFLLLITFITMPWRINFILQALNTASREENINKKSFKTLLWKFGKDYACIAMNLILLLSIVKTKKAIHLILRNYRLNFFKSFLEYSFEKDLIIELRQMIDIYCNIGLLLIALIWGWNRIPIIFKQLYTLYKKNLQIEQTRYQNEKIYRNTVASGKQLKILNKMGHNCFMWTCEYLSTPQLMILSSVSRYTYQMIKQEDLWMSKWQKEYSTKHNNNIWADCYQDRCIVAYQMQQKNTRIKPTYHSIIYLQFLHSVYENQVDLKSMLQQYIPQNLHETIFYDFNYNIQTGYVKDDEHLNWQDDQFLRILGRQRQRKTNLNEQNFYLNWLFYKSIEKIIQKLNIYFSVNSYRYLKQTLLLLSIFCFIIIYLLLLWFHYEQIFQPSVWVGFKFIITVYVHFWIYFFLLRAEKQYDQNWISLKPFDIKQDIINFFIKIRQTIKNRILIPIKQNIRRVALRLQTYFLTILNYFYNIIKKIIRWIKNKITLTSQFMINKIAKPLYIKISQLILTIKNIIISTWQYIISIIKIISNIFKNLLISIWKLFILIFHNINQIYYIILKFSYENLKKIGVIGQLLFTLFGFCIIGLPTILCYFIYHQRWFIITSTLQTMVLIVTGYRHLNKIKNQRNKLRNH